MKPIYLSPPHLGGAEVDFVLDALASNWIAPLGPHVDAFECEVGQWAGGLHAAALASGTAAIHLALRLLGVGPGDEVLCPTFTFCASANPMVYQGAQPVFIDAGPESWNIDPDLLEQELRACASRGRLPRAAVMVDLYGECADYERIIPICEEYGVPVVEDAAEALGAFHQGKPAGQFGRCGIFSFNGNKIITASGGGMLVSRDESLVRRARHLASQARDAAPHYQHSAIGYNYRMSNMVAAIGRGQLRVLKQHLAARRRNYLAYRTALEGLPGIGWMPGGGESNHWLTCITIDPKAFGADREKVRRQLKAGNIESRPVWKPLHLQPVFAGCRARGGQVAEAIFERGLCLPSGSSLSETDLERISGIIRGMCCC
ncbi:MAG TPA: DegT/DnrJ/EryC1/StrS family aminotransferase [Chthoniobacteraceae bacterium]|nr:DegT/DnrJ/EryC1/StrS family aminotransferase [Chthoniobacteraceae bacterium]